MGRNSYRVARIMDKKLLNKLSEKYGGGDPKWFGERKYPTLPLVKRAWLGLKRIANYKIY